MPTKLEGAKRQDAFRFEGEEIERLAVSPQLVRWGGIQVDHVEALAKDISVRGQLSPVLVRKAANGKPELVAGRHRRAAILLLNAEPERFGLAGPVPLTAVYKDLDDEGAIRASFAENTGRPLTCMDLSHTACQLSNLGWEPSRIAEVLSVPHHKVSTARVSALKALIRLPHSVQVRLHDGTLPESAARALLRLGIDAEAMEEYAGQLDRGELKAADLTSLANEQRRQAGKRIRRTLNDLRRKLEEIATTPATDLLGWLDGEWSSDDRLREILEER